MSKTVTIRLDDNQYSMISRCAKVQHRPISNFITSTVVNEIEQSYYVDSIENSQIHSDQELLSKLSKGHKDAQKMRGKFVG
jgi:uncharacterized protein (DUF1778 family)